jgi:xylulokinase
LARGAWVGLTVRHTQAHLTRAVLEGVAFGLRDSFELMKSAGMANITQVRASGGGIRSSLWRQILADVLGVELVTVNTTEGAAYGAALLAAVGAGAFDSVPAACQQVIQVTGSTPVTEMSLQYESLYGIYRELYPALRKSFWAMGATLQATTANE